MRRIQNDVPNKHVLLQQKAHQQGNQIEFGFTVACTTYNHNKNRMTSLCARLLFILH